MSCKVGPCTVLRSGGCWTQGSTCYICIPWSIFQVNPRWCCCRFTRFTPKHPLTDIIITSSVLMRLHQCYTTEHHKTPEPTEGKVVLIGHINEKGTTSELKGGLVVWGENSRSVIPSPPIEHYRHRLTEDWRGLTLIILHCTLHNT